MFPVSFISDSVNYDAAAVAFFGRVTAAGGALSVTEKSAVNQLVLDLKAGGIWNSMKAVYPMVGASAAACAQNLVSKDFTGTFSSGWTYANTGVTPNGTSAYMDTNIITGTEFGNDISFSIYSRTDGYSGGRENGYEGAFTQNIICQYNGGQAYFRNGSDATYTVTTAKGFYVDSTNSSIGNNGYINGVNVAHSGYNPITPTYKAFLGAANNGGTASYFSIRENAFAHWGSSLTDVQVGDFYNYVQNFQTTLSREV